MKEITFLGDSLDQITSFPQSVKRDAGYQLDRVQNGEDPVDWKPMKTIGSGVREIRIKDAAGAFRVVYVANIGDQIYVLHAFQKKTQKTAKGDIKLAKERLKALK
jgi:phage-related protein